VGLKGTKAGLPQSEHLISNMLFGIVTITPNYSLTIIEKSEFPIININKDPGGLKCCHV